jgi:tripartite-type tricarboxylate transporter receptor subunit TctC
MAGFIRRRTILACLACAVTSALAVPAGAQSSGPLTKPIELIAPASPGGGWDTTARVLAGALQEEKIVTVPITVVNKPGGSGVVGWNYMNQHAPDGHFVAMSSTVIHANELLGRTTMSVADVTPIAMLTTEWHAVVVGKNAPVKTGKELMAKLKQDPASLSIGIGLGVGNDDYMSFMKAAKAAGVDVTKLKRIVIFPSGKELMVAILGGHVDVISTGLSEIVEQHRADKVRIVAISAPKRLEGADSDLPTWNEQGIDGTFGHWRGLFGPKGMNAEQLKTWDEAIAKVVKTKSWQEGIAKNGWDDAYMPSSEYKAFLEKESKSFAETFSELGIMKKK